MSLFGDELDLLKRRESTHCDLEVTTRKVADARGDTTNIVIGLDLDTARLYDFIRRGVDRVLVEDSGRLNDAFDCEARSLRQSVRDIDRGQWKILAGSL